MNRQDRDYYEYGPHEGYSRNDERYHSARNLTNEFERDFRRDRGDWNENSDRNRHSYHEGNRGDVYERYKRGGQGILDDSSPRWNEREHDRYQANDYGHNRNSDNSNYRDNSNFTNSSRRDENWLNSDLNNNRGYNDSRQDYGTSHRYNAYNRNNYRGAGDSHNNYSGSGGDDRRSRFGGGYYGSDRNSSTGANWNDENRRRYQTDRYY